MSHNHYLIDRYEKKINFGLDELNSKPDASFVHGVSIYPSFLVCKNVQYFIDSNIKFIYPISTLDTQIFLKEPPKVSNVVIEACNNGLCKVGLFFDTEGTEEGDPHFKWFEKFADKNNLNFTNFFFSHGNRILAKSYIKYLRGKEPKVNILKYSHFQDFPWFIYNGQGTSPTKIEIIVHFMRNLVHNREVNKEKHFLCLNRVPRAARLLIFAVIASNRKLDSKSILSIGSGDNSPKPTNKHNYVSLTSSIHGESLNKEDTESIPSRLQNFINSYDWDERSHILDNLEDTNKALSINLDFHQSTFVNIVTETLHSKKTLFFSEKIFKPIYMLQPFILIGNPHSLRELKKLGYKTFGRWWDESYDEEENLVKRILKIEKVLIRLSKLNPDELRSITTAMEDTLIHNYSVLFFEPKQESLDYFNFLSFNKPFEKSVSTVLIEKPVKVKKALPEGLRSLI